MTQKANESPKLVSVQRLGKSVEGRPILGLRIGLKSETNNKSIVYIDGGTHAREWASITTVLFVIDKLISEFKQGNTMVRNLVRNFNFHIVPVVNPDGYEWSYTRVTCETSILLVHHCDFNRIECGAKIGPRIITPIAWALT